jgi:hypothetical protein
MKEKKQSANWNIAATHYLTSGFAIPFIMGLILGVPAAIIVGKDNAVLLTIVLSIIWLVSIWAGIMYSAKFIAKTYIVNDKNKIATLSTIYLIVLGSAFRLYNLSSKGINISFIIDAVFFVVVVILFYILSKKYLQNTELTMNPTTPIQ